MSYRRRRSFRQAQNALEQVDARARMEFLSKYFLEMLIILPPLERVMTMQKILNGYRMSIDKPSKL